MAKILASAALAGGMNPGAVRTFCELGKYQDDIGLLAAAPAAPAAVELVQPQPPAHLPKVLPGFSATPNAWLRGALFSAIQGKTRKYLREHPINCIAGVEIVFTGYQLDQSDLDVWESFAILCAGSGGGYSEPLEFTAYDMLQLLGRNTGKSDYVWLHSVIHRLAHCMLDVKTGGMTYFGSLLSGHREDETRRYRLSLNSDILKMYRAGWTQIDWGQRCELNGKPLALWLHGFYCTHASPYPLSVELLHKLCGSSTSRLSHFKVNMSAALDDLVAVGAISAWSFSSSGLVEVDREPSSSQRRHLQKKAKAAQARKPRAAAPRKIGDLFKQ